MRKYLTLFFLISPAILSQSTSFDFHSPENIKKFADHLFCEGDYLRAIEQYNCADNQFDVDTIKFKIMLGYSELNLYQYSNEIFNQISTQSKFYPDAYLLSLKNKLLNESKSLLINDELSFDDEYAVRVMKLTNISKLYDDILSSTKEDFIKPFNNDEINSVSVLYDLKTNPPYKSPELAGVMSAIIPGSGKMYVGEWGDGITALLVTSLFAFLAYDNFKADHTTRAWIFTGLGAFFYAGNIYGSIAAAQIFNAKVDFDFSNGLKFFLEEKNYFVPDYEFCN
jgi:TM2 domain-containing membrane protein YozV